MADRVNRAVRRFTGERPPKHGAWLHRLVLIGAAIGVAAVFGVAMLAGGARNSAAEPAEPTALTRLGSLLDQVRAQGDLQTVSSARLQAFGAALRGLAPEVRAELQAMGREEGAKRLRQVVRTHLRGALDKVAPRLTDAQAFFLFTNLQYRLEHFSLPVGLRGRLTFRPHFDQGEVASLARWQEQMVVDQDGDGINDTFDRDDDADGVPDAKDPSDNVTGIPDRWMAREDFDSDRDEDGIPDSKDRGSPNAGKPCFYAGEELQAFQSVLAAKRFLAKRQCGTPLGAGKAGSHTKAGSSAKAGSTKLVASSTLLGASSSDSPGPVNVVPPSIIGEPIVGSLLTASAGTWTGTPEPTLTYVWQRQNQFGNWDPIAGATGTHYTLQPSDAGRVLRVAETAQNSHGADIAYSSVLGPIGGSDSGSAPQNSSPPSISGTPKVNLMLYASPGSWTGSPTPSFAYQWQRLVNGSWSSIAAATAASYIPIAADVGYQLRVQVTASNGSGTQVAYSAAVGPVTAEGTPDDGGGPPVNTGVPAISGTPATGSMLTASRGTWTNSPTSYAYAWQRSTDVGTTWVTISGATSSTYGVVAGDVGAYLRVRVTAANAAGSSSADSAQTTVVTQPAPTCQPGVNSDGDTLPDCDEIAGWDIYLDTTGMNTQDVRKVTSDPAKTDTDGDGVDDGEEFTSGQMDPSRADTDSDGLDGNTTHSSDWDELNAYGSAPNDVDSDGDALNTSTYSVDLRLKDAREVDGYQAPTGETISTSPSLADTDGDAYSDYLEINSGGYRPLVADLPTLQVEITPGTTTGIEVYAHLSGSSTTTTYEGTTTSTTQSTETVDSTNVKDINTYDVKFGGGVSGGKKSFGFNASGSFSYHGGTITDTLSSTTNRTEMQQEYQQYVSDTQTKSVDVEPMGKLSTAITLRNTNTKLAVKLTDIAVSAFQQDPGQPAAELSPGESLAMLTPAAGSPLESGITLAPGQVAGPYIFESTTVSSARLLKLLANPAAIVYSIPAPKLSDINNRPYAEIAQGVATQTATVMIDDGHGSSDPPMTYNVATNVRRDPQDGSNAGATMKSIMDTMIKKTYGTCLESTGEKGLCSVTSSGGQAVASGGHNIWAVMASNGVWLTDRSTGRPLDFDAITLHAGDWVKLLYVEDTDGEGLFDAQESLYGTNRLVVDTDGDTLNDWVETQQGWDVPLVGPNSSNAGYHVYANALSGDIDADTQSDPTERTRKTDPNEPDTNGDGRPDNQQDATAVLAYCPNCWAAPQYSKTYGGPPPSQQSPGDGQFAQYFPKGVAVTPNGASLYAVGSNGVHKFDTATGNFVAPRLALQRPGNAIAATANQVWVMTKDDATHESYLEVFEGTTRTATRDLGLGWEGFGVAADAQGVYFTENKLSLGVVKLDPGNPTGTPLRQFGIPVPYDPVAIALDSARDRVYVLDGMLTVYVFDRNLNLLRSFKLPAAPAVYDPRYMTVDKWGYLYVSDLGAPDAAGWIQKYDPATGTFLKGWTYGAFLPAGIAADGCNVYVANGESPVQGVQRFSYQRWCD